VRFRAPLQQHQELQNFGSILPLVRKFLFQTELQYGSFPQHKAQDAMFWLRDCSKTSCNNTLSDEIWHKFFKFLVSLEKFSSDKIAVTSGFTKYQSSL
jgi:hypothetical protein